MAAGWKVTGQRQTTISNGVTYVPAMIIGLKTEKGNYVNITLGADEYSIDGVKAAAQAAADTADEISAQSAGTVPGGTLLG
jgi:hypothetical protein